MFTAMIDSHYSSKSVHISTPSAGTHTESPATKVHTANELTAEECDLGLHLT